MSQFERPGVVRWIVGIVGGLIVFVFVSLVVGFVARNLVADGVEPWDTIIGFILPNAIALYAGYRCFCRSVWPKTTESSEGRCRKCGYNLTGNMSGVCPECGETL